MSDMTKPIPTAERFAAALPVYEGLAEDEQALQGFEDHLRVAGWSELAQAQGARPLDEPTVERHPNLQYGQLLLGEDGSPILDEDGQPMVDRVKLYLRAIGWAER